MTEEPIYIGRWQPGFVHWLERLPHLMYLSESELIAWSRDHWQQLRGLWVNNICAWEAASADAVVTVAADGQLRRLSG